MAHEAAIPAFDAPAAVDSAVLQAGLATMPRAAEARRAAAPAPPAARPPRQADPITVTLTTRRAVPGAVPVPVPRDAAPSPEPPLPNLIVTPAFAEPVADQRLPASRAEIAPAVPAAMGERVATQPVPAVTVAALPPITRPIVTPAPITAEPAREAAPPAPPVTIDALPTRVHTAGAPPGLAAVSDAAAAAPAPAAPAITIGTVEVVMAPPARVAAPAPRPTPDRGFSRYAAMRSGRDRAW
jgi:hypothetical protein